MPRIVDEIEPVERAYVRIELAEGIKDQLAVRSVVEEDPEPGSTTRRTTLSEEEFLAALEETIGPANRERVEQFYQALAEELGLEAEFKSAGLTLKVPDPTGSIPGVSVLAFHRNGGIYNTRHLVDQMHRLRVPEQQATDIASAYWNALHQIHINFSTDGAYHMKTSHFVPLMEILNKLDPVAEEVRRVVPQIQHALDEVT